MKKVLSLIALTLVIVGLTGCMDNPDGARQSTRPEPSKDSKSF